MRRYAAQYPADLAGVVFVDGATSLQDDRIPQALVKMQQDQRRQMPWQKLLMTLGWYRIHGDCASSPSGSPACDAWIKADSCIPSQIDAVEHDRDAEPARPRES